MGSKTDRPSSGKRRRAFSLSYPRRAISQRAREPFLSSLGFMFNPCHLSGREEYHALNHFWGCFSQYFVKNDDAAPHHLRPQTIQQHPCAGLKVISSRPKRLLLRNRHSHPQIPYTRGFLLLLFTQSANGADIFSSTPICRQPSVCPPFP